MQAATGPASPGIPAVQLPATDHSPLTGAFQLSVHAGEANVGEPMAATEGMNRVPRIRAAVNKTRERVILSFREGGTAAEAGQTLRVAAPYKNRALEPAAPCPPTPGDHRGGALSAARCQRFAASTSR